MVQAPVKDFFRVRFFLPERNQSREVAGPRSESDISEASTTSESISTSTDFCAMKKLGDCNDKTTKNSNRENNRSKRNMVKFSFCLLSQENVTSFHDELEC